MNEKASEYAKTCNMICTWHRIKDSSNSCFHSPIHSLIHSHSHTHASHHIPSDSRSNLNESNLAGSLHGISIGSKTTESLLETIGTDKRTARLNLHSVQLHDSGADLVLVGARIADKDEGVVVFDAAHGLFRVQGELEDGMGVGTGNNGQDSLARVLGVAGKTKGLGETETAGGADLAKGLGSRALDRSLASTLSLGRSSSNRSVYTRKQRERG
jgi:hypothetical protein